MRVAVALGYIDQGQLWVAKVLDGQKAPKQIDYRPGMECDVPEAVYDRWIAALEEYDEAEQALAKACGIKDYCP